MYAKPSQILFLSFYISAVGIILSDNFWDNFTLCVMAASQLLFMWIQFKKEIVRDEEAKKIVFAFLDLSQEMLEFAAEHIDKVVSKQEQDEENS